MELSHVIIGSIVTEKAERLKTERSYTLKVLPRATKVDVKKALKEFYDIDAVSVRVIRVGHKERAVGPYKIFTKRHPFKKVIVTLDAKSKPLDLTQFKA